MASKAKKKVDPFKTKKTSKQTAKINDTLTPSQEIMEHIDAFREAQEQAKHYEAEATIHKDAIMRYAQEEYCTRLHNGLNKSFKVLGDETMVTYVVMDASSGLTEEDVESFAERWGENAAEELIVRDFRSIRFDPKVLEAHYDAVVEALQTLPEEVIEKLFKPMLLKSAPEALEKAKKYAKTNEEMLEMIKELRMKHYLK